jgi:hypothetical protein
MRLLVGEGIIRDFLSGFGIGLADVEADLIRTGVLTRGTRTICAVIVLLFYRAGRTPK